eukprot:CAMPEP_0196793176 /NCGR_PEP_ID=MMETSP1104-20130614/32551_1 /TAXON_ID=33652 /ORGANISM="Cafeteria sp., Strain Caron Lab Isolate" /LENGTH=105 /DNA_ID=CAMNT_0042163547 /DNA_START=20 /DNA_END=333 /DNA_ORIENTATION=+
MAGLGLGLTGTLGSLGLGEESEGEAEAEADASTARPQTLMLMVGLVWSAVAHNRRSCARFLALGGLDAMLDLLDEAPAFLRPLLLGCVADLARSPHAAPFLVQWR